jgi:hypothetical protein
MGACGMHGWCSSGFKKRAGRPAGMGQQVCFAGSTNARNEIGTLLCIVFPNIKLAWL